MTATRNRIPLVCLLLVCGILTAHAQKEYFGALIDRKVENGKERYLYEGTPLQGACRIIYFDIDFGQSSLEATFEDGVEGDTVRRYIGSILRSEQIRLDDRETKHIEYHGSGNLYKTYIERDGRIEGVYREWYDDDSRYRLDEYRRGQLHGQSMVWRRDGTIRAIRNYREGLPDGKSLLMDDTDEGTVTLEYYARSNSPYMTERYGVGEKGPVLVWRTVSDREGSVLYSTDKPDCDFTRIDTLAQQDCPDTTILISDYTRGVLRSLERYRPTESREWIPDGIFEEYYPGGQLFRRTRYEAGMLTTASTYDEDEEPRTDVRLERMTPKQVQAYERSGIADSKYFEGCEIMRPLRIRNTRGEVIFEREDEKRRFEYHGYDPNLGLHQAFSSIGDYNEVCFYIVPDHGGESYLELQPDLLVVNGQTGTIATVTYGFEGEYEVVCWRRFTGEEGADFFQAVFNYTMLDGPSDLWRIHWIGDHSLLLVCGEQEFYRLDIEPDALEGYGCPEEY